MFAATKGYLELIDTILKYNKQPNIKDSFGRNALFYAIMAEKGDNSDIVVRLVEADVNPNEIDEKDGSTCLMIACNRGMKDTVKCLLECGANPNIQNFKGDSGLHIVITSTQLTPTCVEIINLLIYHNANLELVNKDNQNCIDLCVKINKTNLYEILATEQHKRKTKETNIVKELEIENNSISKGDRIKKKFNKLPDSPNLGNLPGQLQIVNIEQKYEKEMINQNISGSNNKNRNLSPQNSISSTNFGLL